MKPAIITGFDCNIPFIQVIPMIRQAGFKVIALGARIEHSGYPTVEGRAKIRNLIEENGLEIDSVHAPFPEGDNLFSLDEAKRLESIRQCKTAIDAALDLNGRVVVIHLIPYGIKDENTRKMMINKGVKSVRELSKYALEKGIKLALENGQKQDYDDVLEKFLNEEFKNDPIGFCYDSGHENVKDKGFKLLEKFSDRLLIVHLHDNLGTDAHMLPYEGNINWDRFMKIFRGLNYPGNFLLESAIANSQFKNPKIFLSEARRRAEKLLQLPAEQRAE